MQPLYENCEVKEWIRIVNNSRVKRKFKIEKIREDEGVCSECSELEGTLEPSSEKQVDVSFNLVSLTEKKKKVHYLVSFDNAPSQIFSLEGQSTYPQIYFSEELLYFGLLKTYTMNRRKLTLRNPQRTAAQVTISNPHRFYILDFYEFYDFEDESCYKRRFNIYNSATGEELMESFSIPPEDEMVLDCFLNVLGEDSIDLEIEFAVKNGNSTKMQVVGEVQDVEMNMSREEINMR